MSCWKNVQCVHDLYPQKHLIMSEACQEGGPHLGDWKLGERYAENIIKDFNNWTEAWFDWNLILDENGGPNHTGNHCSAPIIADTKHDRLLFQSSYFYIGHFSRHIQPGASRILCACSRDNLEVTAFANPDATIVAIVLNQSASSISFCLEFQGSCARTQAPARSITTFTFLDEGRDGLVPTRKEASTNGVHQKDGPDTAPKEETKPAEQVKLTQSEQESANQAVHVGPGMAEGMQSSEAASQATESLLGQWAWRIQ